MRVTFEKQPGKSKVKRMMIFLSGAARDFLEESRRAIKGGEQLLARLEQTLGFAELRR